MNKLNSIILEDIKRNPNAISLQEFDSKSILITGASGLVGTYLIATLLSAITDSGVRLKLYAVIHSEPEPAFKELTSNASIELLRGDLSSHDFFKTLPSTDFIIHAAGYGQPGKFLENPFKTISLNTTLTNELIAKLKKDGSFFIP